MQLTLGDGEKTIIKESDRWPFVHQIWEHLSKETRQAIAQSCRSLKFAAGTPIYQQGQTPLGLYLIKRGTVEIYRQSSLSKSVIYHHQAGELFGYLPLVENFPGTTYKANARAETRCEIFFLPQAEFRRLSDEYPAIEQSLNFLLAQDLDDFTTRIAWEEERLQGLHPYIKPVPQEESLLGSSKGTQKLKQQIEQAALSLKPVVLQAELGTGKTFLAGLIHHRSEVSNYLFAEMDCANLPCSEDGKLNTDALFGRIGTQAGLIELLQRGTLLLDNVQVLSPGDRARLLSYLKTGSILPNHGLVDSHHLATETPKPVQSWVRLILASLDKLELPEIDTINIKLSSLPQRKGDIPDFADYFLEKFCREQNRPRLNLDRADLRRLLSYNYPGNLAELAEILHRAVMMTPLGQSVIPEQVLWSVQSNKNAFRLDLLTHVSWLRPLLLSSWYPKSLWVGMMVIFVPATLLGFLGPQSRDSNILLNLFWAWWWPGYLFLFVFVGRLWCAVCPFMVVGEWSRHLSLWLFPRQQLPWKNQWLNRWGAWVMFGSFVLIYLWEKLWDLPHHAYLSAWLLLVITAGAFIFSVIYERRLWCRHLCPIGGMNGMFAKLSMVELRSTQQVCSSQCSTFGCYKGSEAITITFAEALPTEGQATGGCPLYSHPAQLRDNRDCMLCMTCLKTCPNRSAQLNLRFPALDLLDNHKGFWAEVALLLLLLGGMFIHHTGKILAWLGLEGIVIDSEHLLISIPIVLVLLSIPAILTYGTHAIARFFDREMPDYVTVVYAYLPFTLAVNLAYYIPASITEAGQILPVLARSLGFSGVGLPSLTWSLDVAQFLQGVTLLSALVFSPYPLLRITKRSWLNNLPHLLLMLVLTIVAFKLVCF